MFSQRNSLRIQVGQLVHDFCTVPQDGMMLQKAVHGFLQSVQLLVGQTWYRQIRRWVGLLERYSNLCIVLDCNKRQMDSTQVIEGLCAAGVISECFFKELGGLLVVLFDEHCAAFVIKCTGVITICRHGNICIPLSLLKVLLLQQMKSQQGTSKI